MRKGKRPEKQYELGEGMKKLVHLLVLLAIGLVLAGAYGCSGGGGGGDVTANSSGVRLNAASRNCAPCHAAIAADYALALHNTESAASCVQCHDPAPRHGDTNTTAIANPDAAGKCLDCHDAGGLGAPHSNLAIVNAAGNFDAHASAQYVDAALTSPVNSVLFPGITGAQTGCISCHNAHDTSSKMAILRDYSRNSGHGDINGEAWVHYRWKGADRAACQRCHTTSSFISAVSGGPTSLTYDANDNTKQTLYCSACHTDSKTYGVRPAGQVTATYSGGVAPATTHTVTYPDIGKSNLCMNCHVGRENGDSIALSTANFTKTGFVNSHYLTGGATVYAANGYKFTGRNYANPAYFKHDQAGTAAFPATGNGGPCVSCHMTPTRHTFKPLTIDQATDAVTGIVSTNCAACHTGAYELTVAGLNAEKEESEAGLAALEAQLAARGVFFYNSHPYFFTAQFNPAYTETGTCTSNLGVRNWQTGGTTNFAWNGSNCTTASTVGVAGTAGTGPNNMGAAFNLNLLRHDPGAYAHNRIYAKRLIYDSIDWLDDNTLNDTVEPSINALATISAAQKTSAIEYLLGGPGGTRP